MQTNIYFRSIIGMLSFLSVMLCACSNETSTIPEEEGKSKTFTFQVTNYMQYDMDEGTRAAIAPSESKRIQHLALGIFDATTNTLVAPIQIQDKEDQGYGSFTAKLNYGKYRLVFLGYGGSNSILIMENPEEISFENNTLPQTFLSSFEFTVDPNTQATTSVVLKRVVSGFELTMADAVSSRTAGIKIKSTGGGMVLNAKTGLAKASTGRENTIVIPESYHGLTGKSVIFYLFLPSNEESMDITASAVDENGEAFIERTFTDVPMKINTRTTYQGNFFVDMPHGFSITMEDDWGEEVVNPF
ncbi:MAG: FimB/Mfa2 family fimbrial subunit [Bacteroidaceae bacterium]|nr:FimB/Mfa2 family fimbrial subunit [Paraprevotella sp.]MDY4785989.1 FimB/Mfa2 family fimbrial subunit [Bacteroidaceae bacterium]